ncbi:MAG: hypothetical protein ACOC9Y_00285 [Chloroflexota bacterium]
MSTALWRKTGVGWRVVLPFMAAALIASYALFSMFGSAGAAAVSPEYKDGNPQCTVHDQHYSLGYDNEDKIDELPQEKTYTFGSREITISNVSGDGKSFDWSSNYNVDAVIVKGGGGANIYEYSSPRQSDTDLEYDTAISHVSFCWDDPPPLQDLNISKTAQGSYDLTYGWELDKSVEPDTWHLFDGDSATSDYTVDATRDNGTEENHEVTGTISIENPNDVAIEVTDISDSVNGADATIESDCDTPFDVPAKDSVDCEYEVTSGLDGTEDENTVSVTAEQDLGGEATADFDYELDETFNESLEVEDVVDGDVSDTHTFNGSGTWEYDATFDCTDANYDGDGTWTDTVNNTVRDVDDNDNSSSADVTVNCYELQVSKDAEASFDREITWDIDKSVDNSTHNLQVGESGTSEFTVEVTKDEEDTNFFVEGTITIENPNPDRDAELTALTDEIDGTDVDSLDCDGTETVPAGGSRECDYSHEPSDATDGQNVATVTMQNYDFDSNGDGVDDGTTQYDDAQADVTFGDPNIVGEETVNVEDIDEFDVLRGEWQFSDSGVQDYNVTFDCTQEDLGSDGTGNYTVDNTAEILETDQEDSASVTVNCSEQQALDVSKTVDLEFDRTYEWGITKSVTPGAHTLDVGDTADSTYTVAVTKSDPIDSGWTASGTITIFNPATVSAEVTGVDDVITQTGDVDTDASIDSCEIDGGDVGVPSDGSPVTLDSEETMTCEYSADLPNGDNGTNQATVSTDGSVPGAGTSEDVNFNDATINESMNEIDVTDTYDDAEGAPWNFDSSDSVQYDRTFTCTEDDLGGETSTTFDVDNTAEITQTGDSDDATVTVTCNDIPPEQGEIIVIKDADPDDSPWTFHFDGAVEGEILSGQQLSSGPLDPDTYTVSEDLDELIGDTSGEVAWDLVDIDCVSEDGNSSATTDLDDGSAEIDLGEGDTVTCTFFNEEQPPVVIPEVPAAILFPIIMLGLGGGAYLIHRRRNSFGQIA